MHLAGGSVTWIASLLKPGTWQREALLIRRLAVMATLSAAATLTAACSSVIEQESNLNGLASAQPVALSASQSRALAFDDCNYIVDHLKVPQSAGTKSRAMSYCLGVDIAKYGMN